MVSIRSIPEADLREALELHNQFTAQNRSVDEFRRESQATPSLFIGAYDTESLVGICLGWPTEPAVVHLVGIGVAPDRRGKGIGSRLLEQFERNAKALDMERITVGSAGGYVDRFYVNHGYSPSKILVRGAPESLPPQYRDLGYEVAEERTEDGILKLYLSVEQFDSEELQTVRETFRDEEAIYIMEKTLTGKPA